MSIPIDLRSLNFLRKQGKCPWRVDLGFRPDVATPSHIRQGIADGHEVIVNAEGQAITTAPFDFAYAIVQCVNVIHFQDRESSRFGRRKTR